MAEPGDAIAATLGDLVALPSAYPPGDTTAISDYAARRLRAAGYRVELPCKMPGIVNVVARAGRGRPLLAFNAHSDTVGVGDVSLWRSDPFRAVLADGRLTGLGAANCKGAMAAQLHLAESVAALGGPRRGEIAFTFTGDEERLGPDGMQHLRDAGLRPDMLVLGGPTALDLIVEERGVLWARLTATGRAAHAGEPIAGDNAIDRLLRLIRAIDSGLQVRLPARAKGRLRSTVSLGRIAGGANTNVVPDQAWAEFDRRLLPSERVAEAFAELGELAAMANEPTASWRLELLTGSNGFAAPRNGPCVSAFRQAIEQALGRPARFLDAVGVSDGRWFAEDGIEILSFGPGEGAQGHAANESVAIPQLAEAHAIQLAVVERLLGLGAGVAT
ncbi:MAG: M20 family metallopeptidase [Alphaproteobacteria bacterium]|nr:M20 family metallopeptidase [Alphaproteobacteria bacterium]